MAGRTATAMRHTVHWPCKSEEPQTGWCKIITCSSSTVTALCSPPDSHHWALEQNLELLILPHAKYRDIVNIHPSPFSRLSPTLGTGTWWWCAPWGITPQKRSASITGCLKYRPSSCQAWTPRWECALSRTFMARCCFSSQDRRHYTWHQSCKSSLLLPGVMTELIKHRRLHSFKYQLSVIY